jgi:hypothetical protein
LNVAERRAAAAGIRRRIDERFGAQATTVVVQAFSATSRAGVEAADAALDAWLPRG